VNGSRILIAGAGIGGLVAALALVQRGFEVALYEQAAELHDVGAGLQIAPNGSRVLRAIGLEQALQTMVSVAASREMRLFSTGQSWPMPNAATAIARFGSPIWFVHRGDLHRALVSALAQHAPGAVHVGSRCIGLEQDARGVTLSLENGDRVGGDALIGAEACIRASARRCTAAGALPSPGSWPGARSCRWRGCRCGSVSRASRAGPVRMVTS
jgi:salicylate hydroxylase